LNADVMADKLEIIAKACGRLGLELRAAAVAHGRRVA